MTAGTEQNLAVIIIISHVANKHVEGQMLLLAAVVAAGREHHFRGCKGTVLAYTCVRVARINFNSIIVIFFYFLSIIKYNFI